MKRIGICLPSYNESENIVQLINQIFEKIDNVIVCVVDDNSPDKTFDLLERQFKKNQNVQLIRRDKKDGRGSAIWEGFNFLSKQKYEIDIFVEMDCDFSHSIEDLFKGIKLIQNKDCDILLGSRYPNGTIVNWGINRRVFSFFANLLIRILIDKSIFDYTNGFRFYNKKATKILLKRKPINKGYIYLSESIAFFLVNNLNISSFPIYFKNRIRGNSNTNLLEIYNSIIGIFKISHLYRKWKKLKKLQ